MFFYYVYDEDTINDLKQEGYLMAYELLAKGEYDPSRNLRNYLFTGVRNAMTNFMYKRNRDRKNISQDTLDSAEFQDFKKVTNDDFFLGKVFTRVEYQSDINITLNDIKQVTDNYTNFGDNLLERTSRKLSSKLNLNIKNKSLRDEDNTPPIIYDSIMGEVIWNKVMNLI